MPATCTWFDAHLDLACLAVNGRDMFAQPEDIHEKPGPAGATLPSLIEGRVRLCLGTIFTEPDGEGPEGYPAGDVERAHTVGRAQLEAYLTWRDRAVISLDRLAALRAQHAGGSGGLGEIRAGMGVSEVVPLSTRATLARIPARPPIHLGILIENADIIKSPDQLAWWQERGVVAVGMAWAKSSRYAGGNRSSDGLTPLGKDLVREMDRLGIVHDVSHLSDRAFADLCETTDKLLIASHSNCRAITDPSGANQRHLTDAQIVEIARRGGVIGLNLFSMFLTPRCGESGRATIDETIAHLERICELAGEGGGVGGRRHIGLGSDMDGGFAADRLPKGINRPRDYQRLAEALADRHWSDADIDAFAAGNWMRVFGQGGGRG
jgi:membrane dipeptidase